jgi:hypothetical protein
MLYLSLSHYLSHSQPSSVSKRSMDKVWHESRHTQEGMCLTSHLGRHYSSVSAEELKQLNKVSLLDCFSTMFTNIFQGVMGQCPCLSSQFELDQNLDPPPVPTGLCWL